MPYPSGANSTIYNNFIRQWGSAPSEQQYNSMAATWGVDPYSDPGGYAPAAPTTPTPGPVSVPGGGQAQVYNPNLYTFQQQATLQQQADAAAMERARLSASTQLSATGQQTAATLQAQRLANEAAKERLRFQLADSLSQALMNNDINQANLQMSKAQLAADPRSTVGFLEYLGQAGGGPTAISQNLAAGITPSPVWEYIPQGEGYSPELQGLMDVLRQFVGSMGG